MGGALCDRAYCLSSLSDVMAVMDAGVIPLSFAVGRFRATLHVNLVVAHVGAMCGGGCILVLVGVVVISTVLKQRRVQHVHE